MLRNIMASLMKRGPLEKCSCLHAELCDIPPWAVPLNIPLIHYWFHIALILFSIEQSISTILIPKDPMPILEHQECGVQPGCTYEVRVETANRRAQTRLNITVPGKSIRRPTGT